MKKIFAFLSFILILLSLFSCAEKKPTFFDGDFCARLVYSRLGTEYTVDYSRTGMSERVEIISPENVSGLVATKDNGCVKISIDTLEIPTVAENIFAPFELLCDTNENVSITAEDGIPKAVVGTANNEKFEIKILSFDSERNFAK